MGGEGKEFGRVIPVSEMLQARYNHTATLLPDGRLFVAGGTADGMTSLSSCEIYDPQRNMWTYAGNMSSARMRHTATLLPSGKVLIAGGYNSDGGGHPSLFNSFSGEGNLSLPNCEIYDPEKGEFSEVSPMRTGRFWHRAVLLESGRVLVMGGLNVSLGALSSCEIYDPEKEVWVEAAPLPRPLVRFSATRLKNGTILVSGGHDGRVKLPRKEAYLYIPEKDTWVRTGDMVRGRGYHSAVLLSDGRVLVSGGFSAPNMPDWGDSEIYDPVSGVWHLSGNLSFPRHSHESVLLPGGEVVIIGGTDCYTGGCHSTLEYFDPDEEVWHDANILCLGRKWAGVTPLENGSALITGGRVCITPTKSAELFMPPERGEPIKEGGLNILFYLPPLLIVGAILTLLLWGRLRRGEVRSAIKMEKREGRGEMGHLITVGMGVLIMLHHSIYATTLYLLITLLGTLWFMSRICSTCTLWGSTRCPSGYGVISSKLFPRVEAKSFETAFKQNIFTVALQWFIPLTVGTYLLYVDFKPTLALLLLSFIIFSFVVLPMRSKGSSCRTCPQRGRCPWMKMGV